MGKRITKRYDWLVSIVLARRYKTGAEVGCAQGYITGRLLRQCKGLHLYAVDLWGKVGEDVEGRDTNYDTWDFEDVYRRFKLYTRGYRSRMTVLRGVSWEMADRVPNNSLDFVFIDAGHNYESVRWDILAWAPKLKSRGMLSGHDCNIPGVLQALNELVPTWKDTHINECWESKKENVKL